MIFYFRSNPRYWIPLVIEFLEYNPIPYPEDLVERLAWHKQANWLTFKDLDTEMGRDPEQLSDWLSGRHIPSGKNREAIEFFLAKCEDKSGGY